MTRKPIALITGASRGFGYACALEAARRGYHVVATARTQGALEELDDAISALGGQATLVPLDLTDHDGQKRLAIALYERWGGVDLIIHAAMHATSLTPLAHTDFKDRDKAIALNLTAFYELIANVEPLLAPRDGRFVLPIDPIAEGGKYFGLYGSLKAAQRVICEAWAAESPKAAARVVLFEPAPMPTATRARFHPGQEKDRLSTAEREAKDLFVKLQGCEPRLQNEALPHAGKNA